MGRRDACDRTADGPVLQEGSSRCLARAHLRPDERGAPPARRSLRRRGARGAGVLQQEARRASAHDITSRSEEHTSELQSQSNLVCRLLLEKKNYDSTLRNSALHAHTHTLSVTL